MYITENAIIVKMFQCSLQLLQHFRFKDGMVGGRMEGGGGGRRMKEIMNQVLYWIHSYYYISFLKKLFFIDFETVLP